MMPEVKAVLEECKKKAASKRDEASLVLKKAFCMFFGAALGAKRDRTMACVQNRYQLKFFRLKKKWVEQF